LQRFYHFVSSWGFLSILISTAYYTETSGIDDRAGKAQDSRKLGFSRREWQVLSNLPDINCPDLLVGLPSANLTFKPSLDVIDVRFAGIEPVLRDDFNPAVAGLTVQPEGHLVFGEVAHRRNEDRSLNATDIGDGRH
jgi:hypothetical protein